MKTEEETLAVLTQKLSGLLHQREVFETEPECRGIGSIKEREKSRVLPFARVLIVKIQKILEVNFIANPDCGMNASINQIKELLETARSFSTLLK